MRAVALLVGLVIALAAPSARAQNCPERDRWPTPEWDEEIHPKDGPKAVAIEELEDFAFTLVGEDAERRGLRTNALLIVKSGAIVFERYARGFERHHRTPSFSAGKSMISAITGVAVEESLVSVDDSICDHLPSLPEESCAVRLRHLLESASGFDWTETYEGRGVAASSVLAMLYGEGYDDMAAFVARHPLRAEPGTSYAYSSGDPALLMATVQRRLESRYGPEAAWAALFDRIGMHSVAFEGDGARQLTAVAYATPRDYARFGYLYLNDGCWSGTRVLPEGWVTLSTSVPDVVRAPHYIEGDQAVRGWLWWLNRPVPEQDIPQPMPDVPDDAYCAQGSYGQRLCVIPSRDVIVVRTGDDRMKEKIDLNRLLSLALVVAE